MLLTLFLWLIIACAPTLAASPAATDPVEARRVAVENSAISLEHMRRYLTERRTEIADLRSRIATENVSAALVDEAATQVEAAHIEIESIKLDQAHADGLVTDLRTAIAHLDTRVKSINGDPGGPKPAQLAAQEDRLRRQTLLKIEELNRANLKEQLALAIQTLQVEQERYDLLRARYETLQETQRQVALEDVEKRIEQERDALLTQSTHLRQRLQGLNIEPDQQPPQKTLLETQIKQVDEGIFLLQVELVTQRAQTGLAGYHKQLAMPDTRREQLQSMQISLAALATELDGTLTLSQRKLAVLRQLAQVVEKREGGKTNALVRHAQEILARLITRFEDAIPQLEQYREQVRQTTAETQTRVAALHAQDLLTRRALPLSGSAWQQLFRDLLSVPATVARTLRTEITAVLYEADREHGQPIARAVLGMVGWSLLWLALQRYARRQNADAQGFLGKSVAVLMELFRRHRYRIWLLTAGLVTLITLAGDYTSLPPVLATTLALMMGVPLTTAILRPTLRAWLGEANWQIELNRLWRALIYLLAALAWFKALQGGAIVPESVRAAFDPLFLLALFALVARALHQHKRFIAQLSELHPGAHWLTGLQLGSAATLLTALLGAIIGLTGYINLAWYAANRIGWLLGVLLVWLAARGLLLDAAVALKKWVVARSTIGLFWAQGVIDPATYFCRLLMAVTTVFVLLKIYGIDNHSPVTQAAAAVLEFPLFHLGQTAINLHSVIILIGAPWGLLWFARRARRFTYRWLYAGVLDLGLRHSLSVFTQYAVVLIGVVVILRMLGLDLTSLAIFTGAIGVGIGLGMQNIANNFISGLILLLERPIRAKDWVTIAGAEGEVSNIGFRSVTITTWDRQDVIVPNADLVSQPFTNWTRADPVLRSVVYIGISYDDDPRRAQQVMERAMYSHPMVLKDPAPRAYLRNFGDSSVEFHVQFFLDVQQVKLLNARSEVLLAIWYALQDAGIRIPYPQRDVHVLSTPPLVPKARGTLEGRGNL